MKIVDLPAARHTQVQTMKNWPDNGVDPHEALQRHGRFYELAELFWVTADMTRVAVDAAGDMPAFTMSELVPCDYGFIFFDEPLPPVPVVVPGVDTTRADGLLEELPADWICWWRDGPTVRVSWGCTEQRHWEAGWSPSPAGRTPFIEMAGVLIPPVAFETVIHPDTPESRAKADLDQEGLGKLRMIVTLAATWSMMMQPTVAEKRTEHYQPTKNEVKKKRRRPGTVTTVSLRRMKRVDAEPGASGRKLTHQHVVRGHWKQQAYGPGRSLRKPLWIPSYLAGPEGAPLLAKERVMVWRR